MIATILSFFISLVLLATLLGYKIFRIRNGETLTEYHYDIHSFIPEHVTVENTWKTMIEYGKKYGHEIITAAIRSWYRSMFFLKKNKEIMVPKIKSWIPKKHREIKQPAAVSEFLQNVAIYKAKLKKLSNEIKEEEKKNF
jgi:hypothetical protein